MQTVYEKVGEGRGRPSRFVILDDGTKMLYKDWKAQNKQQRGRKAYPRDEQGNIIRPSKIEVNMEQIPIPEKYQPDPIKEIPIAAVSMEVEEKPLPFDIETDKDINDMTDEEFEKYLDKYRDFIGVRRDEGSRRS